MSVKDIKLYYDEVCDQYHDMLTELRDFEEEAKRGLVEPERLDKIKETIQPLITNYQTLSYIMFLLNKPTKKSKQVKYFNMNKKKLNEINPAQSKQGIIQENNNTLDNLKKLIK